MRVRALAAVVVSQVARCFESEGWSVATSSIVHC